MSAEDQVDRPDAEHPRYHDRTAPAVEEGAVTVRSEEELVLDSRRVPRERVRLVKRVVSETVTTITEVRREELHVERAPLDERHAEARDQAGDAGPAGEAQRRGGLRDRLSSVRRRARVAGTAVRGRSFEEETTDITLMEEQVVVTKRVVPRERVRLRKEVVTEQREISEGVRKERVDVEHTPVTDDRDPLPHVAGRER